MANVLKNASQTERAAAASEVSGLAGFNLNDLADEGRIRLDECRSQIREMLAQARRQAETIHAEAKQSGYEQGLAQAREEIDQRIMDEAEIRARDALERLQQAVQHLHQVHQTWMQDYAHSLSSIAIAAAADC